LAAMSWRARAFVALGLILVAGAAVRYQNAGEAFIAALYVAGLVVCAATDVSSFRVPNVITYPGMIVALLAAAFMPHGDLREALAGGGIAAGFMFAALLISRGAMGLGDVKLAIFVGLALGYPLVNASLMLMAFSGGFAAIILLATGLRGRRDPIPYAPFISAAAITIILWQGTSFNKF
jgi:leader peptidase (prepilin peptidase)/N-methyltransferase